MSNEEFSRELRGFLIAATDFDSYTGIITLTLRSQSGERTKTIRIRSFQGDLAAYVAQT